MSVTLRAAAAALLLAVAPLAFAQDTLVVYFAKGFYPA